jgi:hypothetical protein
MIKVLVTNEEVISNMRHEGNLLLLSVILIVFGFEDSALAYLDPGTGSMVLQLLLGGIAGVVVILKLYWRRFVGLFRGNAREESEKYSPKEQK